MSSLKIAVIGFGLIGKKHAEIIDSNKDITLSAIVEPDQSLRKDINFKYRDSGLSDDLIFLSASFKGFKKEKELIQNEMNFLKEKKEKAQPTRIKTSGSTFKNPLDQSEKKVWELIKESVPLDISFGDAYISEKHCNFFVNKGNAKFKDMKSLIEYVSKNVFEKTGVKLETEIKILE